jgi:hypothetical protein
MLGVVILSIIMLSAIMLSVIMLNVIMLSVIMLSVVMMNVVMLNVVMQNVVMLSVVILSVVLLNVVMMNVVAPFHRGFGLRLLALAGEEVVGTYKHTSLLLITALKRFIVQAPGHYSTDVELMDFVDAELHFYLL